MAVRETRFLCTLHLHRICCIYLGKMIPQEKVDEYLLPIVGGIIVLSFVPSIIHIVKERRADKKD
ncbi:hypothetical protein IQ252_01495 [Tychonema sp. LEGE 07203]|nr:hypothetical protein [Tychonema sp. LEGE 07203]